MLASEEPSPPTGLCTANGWGGISKNKFISTSSGGPSLLSLAEIENLNEEGKVSFLKILEAISDTKKLVN